MAASQSLGELFVKLFFQADTAKLKDFISDLGNVSLSSIAAATGLYGLYNATAKVLEVSEDVAKRMYDFQVATGLSGERLNRFSNAASRFGVGADEVAAGVKNLQSQITRMEQFGEQIPGLVPLGIDPTSGDALDIFDQVVEKLGKWPPAMRSVIAGQLGLSDGILRLVENGKAFRDSLGRTNYVTSTQAEAIEKNRLAWEAAKNTWGVALVSIGARLAPVLERFADLLVKLSDFVARSPLAQDMIMALAAALTAVAVAVSAIAVGSWLSGIGPVILGVTALTAAVVGLVHWLDELANKFDKVKPVWEFIKNLSPAYQFSRLIAAPALATGGGGSVSTVRNDNRRINISVNGGDPMELYRKAKEALDDSLSDAGGISLGENY